MNEQPVRSVLRMRKRHTPRSKTEATAADGRRLVEQQSLRDALAAALVVVVLFGALWAMGSTLAGRIFPWMTLVLGILVGLAVRRAGRGLDWRFPALAAAVAGGGAVASNVVVAAAFTADALDTSTLAVLGAATSMTWPVYFSEVFSPADVAYALVCAALAAFYANRRLSRAQFLALRKWQLEHEDVRHD
jgi:hypothetical protein